VGIGTYARPWRGVGEGTFVRVIDIRLELGADVDVGRMGSGSREKQENQR